LLAFSCKTRYFCPNCHQKRVLLYGERAKKVLTPADAALPVPRAEAATKFAARAKATWARLIRKV
jgi:transposase-like protein